MALGVALVYGLGHYPLPLPEAYYVRELFVGQDGFYLALIIGLSVLVQLAASLVPALWLSRIKPVSVLSFVEGGVV
jgi:ABC-type lipoprotein release transport system permease subunit